MPVQRIHKYYKNIVSEDLLILYNYTNIMQLPKLEFGVVSHTDSKYLLNKKQGVNAFAATLLVTGQKSVSTRAHKSIAAFKLRAGSFIGCKITMRKNRVYSLLDKIYSFVFTSTQNYGINMTNLKNKSSYKNAKRNNTEYLNIGIHKILLLPPLEKFFLFFDSLKGCNVSFTISCPFLKKANSRKIYNLNNLNFSLLTVTAFLTAFQIPSMLHNKTNGL